MQPVKIWEGVEAGRYDTSVELHSAGVVFKQYGDGSIWIDTEHAIDIAFTILKELCPTIADTLEQINASKPSQDTKSSPDSN